MVRQPHGVLETGCEAKCAAILGAAYLISTQQLTATFTATWKDSKSPALTIGLVPFQSCQYPILYAGEAVSQKLLMVYTAKVQYQH